MSKQWKYVKDSKRFEFVITNVKKLLGDCDQLVEPYDLGIVGNRQILAWVSMKGESDYLSLGFTHRHAITLPSVDSWDTKSTEYSAALIDFCFYTSVKKVDNYDDQPVLVKTWNTCNSKDTLRLDKIREGDPWWCLRGEEHGRTEDGALTVYLEIRVDRLIGKDGVEFFNFWDPFEDCIEIWNPGWSGSLYIPRQPFLRNYRPFGSLYKPTSTLILLYFPKSPASSRNNFEKFFQKVNGVESPETMSPVDFMMNNLTESDHFESIIKNNKSLKRFQKVVGQLYLEKLEGDKLKRIVQKFFSYAKDS